MNEPLEWDDELWDLVWERTLSRYERNIVARDVWAGRTPADPMHQRLVVELARRWRSRARNLALAWGAWTLFWGWLGIGARAPFLLLLAAVGVVVVVGSLMARRRLGARLPEG